MATQSNDGYSDTPEARKIVDKAQFLQDFEAWLEAEYEPEDGILDCSETPNDDCSDSLDEI